MKSGAAVTKQALRKTSFEKRYFEYLLMHDWPMAKIPVLTEQFTVISGNDEMCVIWALIQQFAKLRINMLNAGNLLLLKSFHHLLIKKTVIRDSYLRMSST